MPELPEVETVVRDLRPRLIGRKILSVQVSNKALRRHWSQAWEKRLVGRKVHAIRRRGKWIAIEMAGRVSLVIHLGMTGQLTVTSADEPRQNHTHLVLGLNRNWELRFRDVRRFGSATVFGTLDELEAFFQEAGLGPEPFELKTRYWRERLAATARSLKAVLLDQRVVAGVGNIYADESLFEARLHPARPGKELIPSEADRLRRAIARVLRCAIEKRGSSIRDYVDGSGSKGGYQNEFRVYQQVGRPCPRCGTLIVGTRLAGRSTHYCPRCQGPGTRG